MRMGGSNNTGDSLASQPRRYRVPGQPLLNQHQVGGFSRFLPLPGPPFLSTGRLRGPAGPLGARCPGRRRTAVLCRMGPGVGSLAKISHCVGTACILGTQRLGYPPKNTCHLFPRGKTERCQYHRVGQVSIDTSGCSYRECHARSAHAVQSFGCRQILAP